VSLYSRRLSKKKKNTMIFLFYIILSSHCYLVLGVLSLKNEISINQLNPAVLEADTLQFDLKNDDKNIERLKELSISSTFWLSSKNEKSVDVSCLGLNADFSNGRTLKIVEIADVLSQKRNISSGHPFIKDGCLTYLVLYENDTDLNQLLIDGYKFFDYQPYIFALKTCHESESKLFEAQFYSRRLILISTLNKTSQILTYSNENAHERRSNLNGAVVRLADPGSLGLMTELITLCQDLFNFTMKNETWGYDDAIKGLADDQLDFGMKYSTVKSLINGNTHLSYQSIFRYGISSYKTLPRIIPTF
jgi:hypothetical protein